MSSLFIRTMKTPLRLLQGQSKKAAMSYTLSEIGVSGTLSCPLTLSPQECLKSMALSTRKQL